MQSDHRREDEIQTVFITNMCQVVIITDPGSQIIQGPGHQAEDGIDLGDDRGRVVACRHRGVDGRFRLGRGICRAGLFAIGIGDVPEAVVITRQGAPIRVGRVVGDHRPATAGRSRRGGIEVAAATTAEIARETARQGGGAVDFKRGGQVLLEPAAAHVGQHAQRTGRHVVAQRFDLALGPI